jgi:hypothetical protein
MEGWRIGGTTGEIKEQTVERWREISGHEERYMSRESERLQSGYIGREKG